MMTINEIINVITNQGIGIACVGYIIYFQLTTMKEMLGALNSINERLILIEDKILGDVK